LGYGDLVVSRKAASGKRRSRLAACVEQRSSGGGAGSEKGTDVVEPQPQIEGAGAMDSQRLFFEMGPSLSERDYLLTVFRELCRFGATEALFDASHNPVWLLAPSAEAAKGLLALFRSPDPAAPAFRFGQGDTRFLGDLYQDLDEGVRKRFALLQTPRFVESYILDKTLDRAIDRFGLSDTTLIDPTCGSGHFLLGAFERLTQRRREAQPGLEPAQAAHQALDQVYGADINPYAVAIARFRLTLAYLDRAGYQRLRDAPMLPLHLAVADSLLHNPQLPQRDFSQVAGQSAGAWSGEVYALDDEEAARDVLHRRYAAVVGNPPYITVKDKVLARRYQEDYLTASGKYSLAAPFCERFFQLGRDGGAVGMITANSFMKRTFGRKLIEDYLPTVNLDRIVNTSGAYIPGHGTPTVLLFGTAEAPQGEEVLAVLAKRGEPTTPDDAEQGHVWRSIAEHGEDVGFDNDYVTIANVERSSLAEHPWSLSGGGADELKELLESKGNRRLGEVVESIGVDTITRASQLLELDRATYQRLGVESECLMQHLVGEEIRDWSASPSTCIPVPYDRETWAVLPEIDQFPGLRRFLWPHRSWLAPRWVSGGTRMTDVGLPYWAIPQLPVDKHRTPLSIAFAFVATHNHFVLDRGGKVFKQSAPIIKLPEDATEDDHLALLAYLNSSTAGFFFRTAGHSKGAQGVNEGHKSEQWEQFLEYSGTLVGLVPLPPSTEGLSNLASRLNLFADSLGELSLQDLEADMAQGARTLRRMVTLQEELDWLIYSHFGLLTEEQEREHREAVAALRLDEAESIPELEPGHRPFEAFLHRECREEGRTTAWFERNGYKLPTEAWSKYPTELRRLLELRLRIMEENKLVGVLERPEFKRRWTLPDIHERAERRRRHKVLEAVEMKLRAPQIQSARELLREQADANPGVVRLVSDQAVPFLTTLRFKPGALDKRAAWQRTWELQRQEDAGQSIGEIPVPPKYKSSDYASTTYWRLRGKLDVPKERFISYPGCESDEDGEPLYGWAGWNHLEQAQALAALYQERKNDGWEADRLTPMLAGLLELVPWVKQWHNEPSEEFGGLRLGDYFEGFVSGECSALGLTEDDLRNWRPPEKKRGRRR